METVFCRDVVLHRSHLGQCAAHPPCETATKASNLVQIECVSAQMQPSKPEHRLFGKKYKAPWKCRRFGPVPSRARRASFGLSPFSTTRPRETSPSRF